VLRHPGSRAGILALILFAASLIATTTANACGGSGCVDGGIKFGSSFKQGSSSLTVVNPASSFKVGQTFALVAWFRGAAGTIQLTLAAIGPGGTKSLHYTLLHSTDVATALHLRSSVRALLGITRAGKYTMELLKGKSVLAKGSFSLTS